MSERDIFQVPKAERIAARQVMRRERVDSMPDLKRAPLPIALRGPLMARGILVWCGEWMVLQLPGNFPIADAYKIHSGALLAHEWFTRACYKAVIDLLRDEEEERRAYMDD